MVTEDESSRIDLVNNSEGKDLDPESDDWTVEITRNPINGNAHVESDQWVIYTPTPDFDCSDIFQYRTFDEQLWSAYSATVLISIEPKNDPPEFSGGPFTRDVANNAEPDSKVGEPVTASDIDIDADLECNDDELVYTLEGQDASFFDLGGGTGQITLRANTVLDPAVTPIRFVEVIARDSAFEEAKTAVAIKVVNQGSRSSANVGGGGGGGPPPIPIPSDADFDWNVTRDIDALDRANDLPTGIWSDGAVLWVVENSASGADRVFAYDLLTGERLAEHEFEFDRRNRFSHGIWSDSDVVRIADAGQDKLFAYNLDSGERVGRTSATATHAASADARRSIRSTRSRRLDNLDSGALLAEHSLDKLNQSPRGIWSDGDEIWVADKLDDKLYSYNIPDATIAQLDSLELSDIEFGEFSPLRTEYQAEVAGAVTTVTASPAQVDATVTITPHDADADPENGHQVAIGGDLTIAITVVSKDKSRTRSYVVRLREPASVAAAAAANCLRGLSDERISTVSYVGGSVRQLGACAREDNVAALFFWDGRIWRLDAPDGPDLLNRSFQRHFAEGLPVDTSLVGSRAVSASGSERNSDN